MNFPAFVPPTPSAIETHSRFSMLDPFVVKYGERGFIGVMELKKFIEVRRADFKTASWSLHKPAAIPEEEWPAWRRAMGEAICAGLPSGIEYNVPVSGKLVEASEVDGQVFEWVP